MRSPIVLVLALTGVFVWFRGSVATPAQADFLDSIVKAKTVKYKMTVEIKGSTALTVKCEEMELGDTRSRREIELPDKSKMVEITDWNQGKSLHLNPAIKQATILIYSNTRNLGNDSSLWIRLLQIARDSKNKQFERVSLGEKEIDGRRAVGFRICGDGCPAIDLWGDPETGLPIRVEGTTGTIDGTIKATLSDFEFNVDLDESLFSVEPPAGYTVRNEKIDSSPNEEKDLIEMFRDYAKLSEGAFPDSLDMRRTTLVFWTKGNARLMWEDLARAMRKPNEEQKHRFAEEVLAISDKTMDKMMSGKLLEAELQKEAEEVQRLKHGLIWEDIAPEKVKANEGLKRKFEELMEKKMPQRTFDEEIRKIGGDQMLKALNAHFARWMEADSKEAAATREAKSREFMEAQERVQRGLRFANQLPPSADVHYVGKGVSLGVADKPIFWYRPNNAKKYRVVYADLSVRDVDPPSNVSNAQAVSAPASLKK
jgi:outer membrane lipoprotein-sorting protein